MENTPDKALLSHQKFAKLIKESHYTQEYIAEKLDISVRYLRKLKSQDQNISISLASKISKLFDCSIESLLTVDTTTQNERQDIGLYSINQIIWDSVLNHMKQFTDKNIKIKTRLTQNLPHILLNRPYITQVIVNCLRNSYASILAKNKPDKRIFIYTRLAPNQKMEEILILDNGIGITPGHKVNYFEDSDIAKLRNNSIDANISMAIIKRHGGNMSITSQLGKGSCTYIKLPIPDAHKSLKSNSTNALAEIPKNII